MLGVLDVSLGAALQHRTFCHQGPSGAKLSALSVQYGMDMSRRAIHKNQLQTFFSNRILHSL